MLNKETYLNVLTRYFDSIREDSDESVPNCAYVSCRNCMFNNSDDACPQEYNIYNTLEKLEKWSKKNPQKHKVSKLEYDILDAYTNLFDFGDVKMLNFSLFDRLHEIGYFKGVTKDMYIKDYFKNCEVEEDDGWKDL